MSWFPCLCGHRTDEHYLRGVSRTGPCKASGCSCQDFKATNRPPPRREPASAPRQGQVEPRRTGAWDR